MNRVADCQPQTDVLDSLENMTGGTTPIDVSEFRDRLAKLQSAMQASGVDAVYLNASTNLYYFTGLKWSPSERMVAAIIPSSGEPCYIAPQFELDTLRDYWQIPADIHAWEEHECPYALAARVLNQLVGESKTIGIDEATPFFILNGLQSALPGYNFQSAQPLTQKIRSRKTKAELDLIRRAHEMTLSVHAKVAEILQPGISTTEVEAFIIRRINEWCSGVVFLYCLVRRGDLVPARSERAADTQRE